MARGSHMHWLKGFSVVLCAALLAFGIYAGQLQYFMFAILPALIAYSAHQTGPHIRAASRALRSGMQMQGLVEIEVEDSSDSQTFYATVASEPDQKWRFEFIPLGWKPAAGQMQATLYTLHGISWPALIEVQAGVIYPRYTPKPVRL
ncbi:hypothetical protein NBRC116584_32670 [Hydrogenophaga sp. 5NK40-0174]